MAPRQPAPSSSQNTDTSARLGTSDAYPARVRAPAAGQAEVSGALATDEASIGSAGSARMPAPQSAGRAE